MPKSKILVEDEWITEKDIKNSLKKLDYSVSEPVSTGEDAIQKAIELQPNVIFMNIVLLKTEYRVQVQDPGINLSAHDQKCLFEPFFRGKNVGKIIGAGLGLTIVKRSVELQGGKITVESEVGRGTTFTVQLPLRNPNPKSTETYSGSS